MSDTGRNANQPRWAVSRYQSPYIAVEAIRQLGDTVELQTPHGTFTLSCDNAGVLDDALLPTLEALRNPTHEMWRSFQERRSDDNAKLDQLIRELDYCGLIRDSVVTSVGVQQSEMERGIDAWSADLANELANAGPKGALLIERLIGQLADPPQEMLDLLVQESLFPLLSLRLQARFLREHAPGVLGLVLVALRAAIRIFRREGNTASSPGLDGLPRWAEEEWSCGLVDPSVMRQYLGVTSRLIRDAFSPDAARRIRAPSRPVPGPTSGINFVLELETEVAESLNELGPSAIAVAMEDRARAQRAVKLAFLQEYLVTCRFADSVAPLLARQFAPPLRDAVHRYFVEEIGHEQFERENCRRLGFTEKDIDDAELLPLHMVFVDVLTNAAREAPLAFFCSSMFTEGFIGTRHSLLSLVEAAFPGDHALITALGEHVSVNEEGDHRGVGRDWMSHVPVVSERAQLQAREWVTYLAELNWRMWARLVKTCH